MEDNIIPASTITQREKPLELAPRRVNTDLASLAQQAQSAVETVGRQQGEFESSINTLMQDLTGEEKFRSDVESSLGLPETQRKMRDLSTRSALLGSRLSAQTIQNELNAIGTGETRSFLDAQDARARRETAIDQLQLASEAMMTQGNFETAKAYADTAVNARFEPMRQQLEIRKFNLERIDDRLSGAQKEKADAQKALIERDLREVDKQQDFSKMLLQNGAPISLVKNVATAGDFTKALTTPGIEKYMKSPLERAQISKMWADINEMKSIASPGLTEKQRQMLLKDPVTKQAASRVGVISAVQEYSKLVEQLKGRGLDFNRLIVPEKTRLETALKTTVGSAINVAQGQGAMGLEEAKQILGNLRPLRIRRTKSIQSAVQGVVDSQSVLLETDLANIDSAIPGATDSYQLFADYKKQNLPDQSLVPETEEVQSGDIIYSF